jgi:hypothetical protein
MLRNNFELSLLMAIKSNTPKAITTLANKVDVTVEIENKQTPIQLAYTLGHWDCVEAIAKNKKTNATDTARYGDALRVAVQNDRIDTARILLEAGASRTWYNNSDGDRCLHIAVRRQNKPMIALLLSFDSDLSIENTAKYTPIQLAYILGHWDCVEAIAKNKKTNATDTARILLEAGASRTWYNNSDGDRCLHIAVRRKNATMVALLLFFDCDVTAKNTAGETAEQVGKSLNDHSLSAGWKIYYYNFEVLPSILIMLVQARRQSASRFYGIPDNVLYLFVSYLSGDSVKSIDAIKSTRDSLTKISANCLIKSHNKGFSIRHSAESKKFVSDLKKTLENENSINITETIQQAANVFVQNKGDKKSETVSLLYKYKLTTFKQKRQDETRKTSIQASVGIELKRTM